MAINWQGITEGKTSLRERNQEVTFLKKKKEVSFRKVNFEMPFRHQELMSKNRIGY